jgi:hypothetical protein
MSSWKERAEKIQSNWRERAIANTPDVPVLESAIRGGVQGATLGFGDEIQGALEGTYDFAKENLLGDGISLEDAYIQARNKARDANKMAQAANPGTYLAGDVVGSGATMFVPGLNIAKGATLAARAGKAALGGAASGLGLSDEITAGGLVKDTAIGGALGAGLQSLGDKVLGPAAGKVSDWVADSGPAKAFGKIFAGVTPENTERYLQRQAQVNAAPELEDIGRQFVDPTMEKMQTYLSGLDDEAWKVLKTGKTIKKDDVVNLGEDFISNLLGGKRGKLSRTAGTGADSDKIAAIRSQLSEIENAYGKKMSESDLKSIVQNLQKLGWSLEGAPNTSHQGAALRELSGLYNNTLKQLNTTYATKMEPVAEATANLKSIERQFINRKAPDQIDKFLGVAKKFDRPTVNKEARDSLQLMDTFTGDKIEDQIRDRLALDAFDKADTNGSRKTLLGKAIGGAIGAGIGYGGTDNEGAGAVGAVAGFSADKYAGKVFKQLLNGQLAAGPAVQKISAKLGKFAQPLQSAAQRGNSAVAATHFVLSQTNPEYRNLVKQLDEDEANE